MKVIAQTAALQEALNLVTSIVAARTPKPILQCIKMVAENNTLTLMATDLEAGARYEITAVEIVDPGEALIPADKFAGIVRKSGDESLTIETENQACHIRGAGTHFKVFGYDSGEYPAVAEFGASADFKVPAKVLSGMISKTLFATAKAHSHYAISGVLWEASQRNLQLVATDGHRLAMAKGQFSEPAARDVTAIVPVKLMSLIQKISSPSEENIEVRLEENQIIVRTARAVLVSSLVQGNFPKYGDVIPSESSIVATVNVAQFGLRVEQAALLTNAESRGVKLSFTDSEVKLSSRAPEAGEAEVTCPITLQGNPIDIGFNPAFLLDALKVADADSITFEMNTPGKPAVLKVANEFLYVIMPVSLE